MLFLIKIIIDKVCAKGEESAKMADGFYIRKSLKEIAVDY